MGTAVRMLKAYTLSYNILHSQMHGRRPRDAISNINELATGKSGTPTLVVREVTQLTRLRETTECNFFFFDCTTAIA